jgi:hypothetical protein
MKTKLSAATAVGSIARAKQSILQASLASLVLSSVCLVSQAADTTSGANRSSYTIKIISKAPAANSKAALTSTPVAPVTGTLVSSTQRTMRLSDGGVVWVSNDPLALTPSLGISSSQTVEMVDGQFKKPLSFKLSTNYAAFIKQWEIQVFNASDAAQLKPLANLAGTGLINGQTVSWDGRTPDGHALAVGDSLSYALVVKDAQGHTDKTSAQSIHLQAPGVNLVQKALSETHAVNNRLATQTIPLQGAKVRLMGNGLSSDQKVTIDGETIKVTDNKFVVERILPSGQHHFNVAIKTGQKTANQRLSTQVDGRYLFMVGLADVTVGKGKVTGNMESLADGDKYLNGDVFVDGRLAFYLKGKIKGKYLVTAQMDTGTADIEELFDHIHKKDPQSLFRRLDPDQYYPVYGDDSSIVDDTNSQGKLYVRVDWDKSQAIWGNFNTDITGTELSAFNRSLYGAKLNHRSTKTTALGQPRTDVTVFGSEAQSASRHNQFLGTGGSLYYLKDKDIVEGSEKVWVEVRERNGDRVVQQVPMVAGRDYQMDDFQGRLILSRPLLQIAEQAGPSLVKDTPLDGNTVYLMVDYEYVPDGFDADKASYGARGKVWLNDHIAVGGTYVHEKRDNGSDYALQGADITLQKGKGTYVVAEYAETEALQSQGSFYSTDGGLQFGVLDNPLSATNIKGTAYSLEARAELGKKGSVGAWYKHRDAGFSTSRLAQGTETVEAGAEAILNALEALKLSAKGTVYDQKTFVS